MTIIFVGVYRIFTKTFSVMVVILGERPVATQLIGFLYLTRIYLMPRVQTQKQLIIPADSFIGNILNIQ